MLFLSETPRNDFLHSECTNDAREFVCSKGAPKSLNRRKSLERLVMVQCARVRANGGGDNSRTGCDAEMRTPETRIAGGNEW